MAEWPAYGIGEPRRGRECVMHWFGEKKFITLKSGEFRLMDASVIDKDEMLNLRAAAI